MNDLLAHQYDQYHEMRRQMNTFSWQVPSLVAAVIVAVLGFGENAGVEPSHALRSTMVWSILALFSIVMLAFHRRNRMLLRHLEGVLTTIETETSKHYAVFAEEVFADERFSACDRIQSSGLLTVFLSLCTAVCLLASGYFFKLWLTCPAP